MTIEELLNQLEAERAELEGQYRNYYDKAVEAKKEIKRFYYYEELFLSPDGIPPELIETYENYEMLHTATVSKHNRILSAINIIKERVGG